MENTYHHRLIISGPNLPWLAELLSSVAVEEASEEQLVVRLTTASPLPEVHRLLSIIAKHFNVDVDNAFCDPKTGNAGLTEFRNGEDESRCIALWDCIYDEERNDWNDLLYEDQQLWRDFVPEREQNERRFVPDVFHFLEDHFDGELPPVVR